MTAEPPARISLLYCPACGRTDRNIPFRGRSHYAGGSLCTGVPILLDYELAEPNGTAGNRYRLVTRDLATDHEDVSTVVLSEDEAAEHLELEAKLHEQTGAWKVLRVESGDYLPLILARSCSRGKTRMIFARCYSPMHDIPEGGTP